MKVVSIISTTEKIWRVFVVPTRCTCNKMERGWMENKLLVSLYLKTSPTSL